MKLLCLFSVKWVWWSLRTKIFAVIGFYERESLFGDENDYTHIAKSLLFLTLTVEVSAGWTLAWGGAVVWICSHWAGHCMGWEGDIRGRWLVNPSSSSRRHSVACFFLFNWSVGTLSVSIPIIQCRRLVRGLIRCLLMWLEWGLILNPGDIRMVWLGGISFRCSPPCSHPPNPEANIGYRNLGTNFDLFCRWGGVMGWVIYCNSICSKDSRWPFLRVLNVLLYRALGRLLLYYLWTYESWKVHIKGMGHYLQFWRRSGQAMPSNECKGKMVKIMYGVFGFLGWDRWKHRTCNVNANHFMAARTEDLKSWLTYDKVDMLLLKMQSCLMLRDCPLSSDHRCDSCITWYCVKLQLYIGGILVHMGWVMKTVVTLLDLGCRSVLVQGAKSWVQQILKDKRVGSVMFCWFCKFPLGMQPTNQSNFSCWWHGSMHWIQNCYEGGLLSKLSKSLMPRGQYLPSATIHGLVANWWLQAVLLIWVHQSSKSFCIKRGISVIVKNAKEKKLCTASVCKYTKLLEWRLQNKCWAVVLLGLWPGVVCTSFQMLSSVFGRCFSSELDFTWYLGIWSGYEGQHQLWGTHIGPIYHYLGIRA
ncbi:hypothetical protein HanPI659440_Chr07g0278341 [Helianthus annuus]|nr:hypothetical protein HanPI659440_Chr07g0278341 [Helianthus annuus]